MDPPGGRNGRGEGSRDDNGQHPASARRVRSAPAVGDLREQTSFLMNHAVEDNLSILQTFFLFTLLYKILSQKESELKNMNNDAGAPPCLCPRPTWGARVVLQEPGEERKMPVKEVKNMRNLE